MYVSGYARPIVALMPIRRRMSARLAWASIVAGSAVVSELRVLVLVVDARRRIRGSAAMTVVPATSKNRMDEHRNGCQIG